MKGMMVEKNLESAVKCPLDQILKFLALEWTVDVVWTLSKAEVLRFGELKRHLPGAISSRVLSMRLKQMQGWGFIHRDDRGEKPQHVSYSLTEQGRALNKALKEIETICGVLSLPMDAPEA